MKPSLTLTVASVLSVILMAFHLAADFVLGYEDGTATLVGVPILVVWLYVALVLAGRRWGYLIVLLLSLLGAYVPVVHLKGAAAGGTRGGAFFVGTLVCLGVTAGFSAILAGLGLWGTFRRRPAAPTSGGSAGP